MFLMRGQILKKSPFLYRFIDVFLFPPPGGTKSGSPRYRVIYVKNTYITHCECTILGLVGTSAFNTWIREGLPFFDLIVRHPGMFVSLRTS